MAFILSCILIVCKAADAFRSRGFWDWDHAGVLCLLLNALAHGAMRIQVAQPLTSLQLPLLCRPVAWVSVIAAQGTAHEITPGIRLLCRLSAVPACSQRLH